MNAVNKLTPEDNETKGSQIGFTPLIDTDFDDWYACPLAVHYEEQETRGKYLNVMV